MKKQEQSNELKGIIQNTQQLKQKLLNDAPHVKALCANRVLAIESLSAVLMTDGGEGEWPKLDKDLVFHFLVYFVSDLFQSNKMLTSTRT